MFRGLNWLGPSFSHGGPDGGPPEVASLLGWSTRSMRSTFFKLMENIYTHASYPMRMGVPHVHQQFARKWVAQVDQVDQALHSMGYKGVPTKKGGPGMDQVDQKMPKNSPDASLFIFLWAVAFHNFYGMAQGSHS